MEQDKELWELIGFNKCPECGRELGFYVETLEPIDSGDDGKFEDWVKYPVEIFCSGDNCDWEHPDGIICIRSRDYDPQLDKVIETGWFRNQDEG